jgi:hypothetical protein
MNFQQRYAKLRKQGFRAQEAVRTARTQEAWNALLGENTPNLTIVNTH